MIRLLMLLIGLLLTILIASYILNLGKKVAGVSRLYFQVGLAALITAGLSFEELIGGQDLMVLNLIFIGSSIVLVIWGGVLARAEMRHPIRQRRRRRSG